MEMASRRTGTLLLAGLASLAMGCQTLPGEGPYGRSRVAQGAILGSMTGAAIGAGIDHANRGRGALIGAVGGLLAGAMLGGEVERQEAREQEIAHASSGVEVWCDEHQAWEPASDWDDGEAYPEEWDGRPAPDRSTAEEAPQPDPDAVAIGRAPPDVLFDAGSVELSPGAKSGLRRVADRLRADDDLELLLRGHTDGSGQESFDLSELRARKVRALLALEGVPLRRIAWVGFGDAQPVASAGTAEGRQRNRRVEVVLRERPHGVNQLSAR